MRHRVKTKKLNRHAESRSALLRGLAVELFKHGKINTTLVKAKYARPYVEQIVTRARENTLANRRLLIAKLHDKEIVQKLLEVIGPKFVGQNGGYTRIQRTNIRFGDVTQMAQFEFVKNINEVIYSDVKKSERKDKSSNTPKNTDNKSDDKKDLIKNKKPQTKKAVISKNSKPRKTEEVNK